MGTGIVHKGTVTKVTDSTVTIRLASDGGDCSGCAIASLCNKAEEVTVPYTGTPRPVVGSKVKIETPGNTRTLAMWLYLVIPLILLVLVPGVTIDLGLSQTLAAVITLAVLAAWYACIYLARRKVDSRSSYSVIEIN